MNIPSMQRDRHLTIKYDKISNRMNDSISLIKVSSMPQSPNLSPYKDPVKRSEISMSTSALQE